MRDRNAAPVLARKPMDTTSDSKERACLRCQTLFRSEWAGERICMRCKGSSAWRAGKPLHSHPTKLR